MCPPGPVLPFFPEVGVRVCVEPELVSFQEVARGLLARQAPPEWVCFEEASPRRSGRRRDGGAGWLAAPVVPRDFLALAEKVLCHTAPERWDLLYRVLWRLTHGERGLLSRDADLEVRRLRGLERDVRREMREVVTRVRFRRVVAHGLETYVAWHEPEHRVVRLVARFLVRRFSTLRWSLLTPAASAHWDLDRLTFGPGAAPDAVPGGARAPARREPLSECGRCPLHGGATRGVRGEGPPGAAVMLVGDAPGVDDDRLGRPFIGQEGRLLEEVLSRAGLRRAELYLTYVVKHFVGAEPRAAEVAACRPWWEEEVAAVRPRIIITLGDAATRALQGNGFHSRLNRGQVLPSPWAEATLATLHPLEVLSRTEPRERAELRIHLEADVRAAVAWVKRTRVGRAS
ncbi:DUF4130 domain-containing protein [Myxococcus stipitatus]|uniref:DUF4130 domain-containing protein n=1 Tax=Myxococcus stipitatus TaxID=83455 RepID=UPI001F3EB2A0|nr:DUF4130 domain-containing protein [Myxococcus stipitatus]MCE9670249.1 DUF4130 domain-containing protein [Myxococcus stipitatus]